MILLDSVAISPSLPPSEGSIHYRLLLDPDNVSADHLTMECVVVNYLSKAFFLGLYLTFLYDY